MRVAIVGHGAIGHVVERALRGRADLVIVDRTRAPLREREAPVEAAVVCVKTHGNAWAADVARRILAPDGVALTIQNGLGNEEPLRDAVGADRVAVGVIYVGARMDGDALVATGAGRAELGRPRGASAGRALERLAALLGEGGMSVSVVDDVRPSVWRKVLTNAALNPTTALLGITNGELLAHPLASRVADALAREVARVATAAGVPIAEEDAAAYWRSMVGAVAANRSSMLQDVEAGRVTEIEAICGAVSREAERRGVDAPLNQAMAVLISSLSGS